MTLQLYYILLGINISVIILTFNTLSAFYLIFLLFSFVVRLPSLAAVNSKLVHLYF